MCSASRPPGAACLRQRLDGDSRPRCIRDSSELAGVPLGVKALQAVPKESCKEGTGKPGVVVCFAGITFAPGQYLYADGIIVSDDNLLDS